MLTMEAINQWGTENLFNYYSREEAEKGAVRLLRAGYVRVRLLDEKKRVLMSLTQQQLKLFEGDPKWTA